MGKYQTAFTTQMLSNILQTTLWSILERNLSQVVTHYHWNVFVWIHLTKKNIVSGYGNKPVTRTITVEDEWRHMASLGHTGFHATSNTVYPVEVSTGKMSSSCRESG